MSSSARSARTTSRMPIRATFPLLDGGRKWWRFPASPRPEARLKASCALPKPARISWRSGVRFSMHKTRQRPLRKPTGFLMKKHPVLKT
ncbi:LOW QUALITY PROTEIN: thiamine-phosphate pyrophosphorylase, partial [Brucella pinnipedialis B2/94]